MGLSKNAKNGIFGVVSAACLAVVGWIVYQHEKPTLEHGPEQVYAWEAECGKPKGWASICAVEGINAKALTKYVEQINQQGYLLTLQIQKRCSAGDGTIVFSVDPSLDDAGVSCFGQDPLEWCNMDGTPEHWYLTHLEVDSRSVDGNGRQKLLSADNRMHPNADVSYLTALYHSLGWQDWTMLPQSGHVLNRQNPGKDSRGTDCVDWK